MFSPVVCTNGMYKYTDMQKCKQKVISNSSYSNLYQMGVFLDDKIVKIRDTFQIDIVIPIKNKV